LQTHSFAKQASEALLNVLAQVTEAKPGPPEKAVIGKTYRHDADLAKNKWPIVEVSFIDSPRRVQRND